MQQKIKIIILILAVILLRTDLFAFSSDQLPVNNCPQEKIEVHVTQESAFPGEIVWFKVYCTSSIFPKENLSTLAFIELVSNENASIIRKKILLSQGEGLGEFEIPNNLPTGLYHILAYTNWMKNFGESSFFKKALIIVNPNQPINNVPDSTDSLKTRKGTAISHISSNKLNIIVDKNKYSTREKATLKLETNNTNGKAISGDFSVSVYREEPQMIFNINKSKNAVLNENPEKIIYLPDFKGIRMSGKLIDTSENGVSGTTVTESSPGRELI